MQPTNYNVPPGELPRPQYEDTPQLPPPEQGGMVPESQQAQAIEQGMSVPADQPTATPPQVLQAAIPTSSPPPAFAQTDDATSQLPAIADDADLIEKEWVTKAKQIVERTKTDPYQQTKEMNKMKADYLQKRYAKELKLPED